MSTPMFQQYLQLKEGCPNAILFYRMGDFYEMFYEDAEIASRELDLTLTARNKHEPDPVPMAGVPYHAAAPYIQKLLDAGYRVAIAEQVEDPALAKGLVRREVTRVVTPGMVLDPSALEARAPCWMAAVIGVGARFGVAFLDATTGDLRCTDLTDLDAAIGELHRMEPREALLGPGLPDEAPIRAALRRHTCLVSEVAPEVWRPTEALALLKGLLGDGGLPEDPSAPGARAAAALLAYAQGLLGRELGNVHALQVYRVAGYMVIDDTSRRNLEIQRTLIGGRRKGSLLGLLDRTGTPMGSRLLREWLAFPLLDRVEIGQRQAAVAALVDDPDRREPIVSALREVADVERIVARVAQGTAHARDLAGLRRSLEAAPRVAASLASDPRLARLVPADLCDDVAADVAACLVDDPPLALTEGGLIREGFHAELDELVRLSLDGVGAMEALEAREREATGIATLKVRSNKVWGYFIEVTNAHKGRIPKHYVTKQQISTGMRFITAELKELEDQLTGASERRVRLEQGLFNALRERVGSASARLQRVARALAEIDVLACFAEVAVRHRWARPEVVEEPALSIVAGRHPVVEASLQEERFVPNDLELDGGERRLVVLTGPNMSGKSTIMRQVALIALLAQVGSFVPAEAARVGLVDRVFTRVGAADDLASGRSTFMVEMSETAAILADATARSLVLLDEIGRGTSTYDGLSIAWAVAEDLADRVRCRAIFATHYHELCELAESRPGVINQSVAVSESGDRVVFLRRLKEGGASRSYGIQCARIAGLPGPVVERARTLLKRFEKHGPRNEANQLSLFGAMRPFDAEEAPAPVQDPLRERLRALDPDALTPREALHLVYDLLAHL